MSKELFSVYHCKACNKIEVSQYISREQMEELGFTEEMLKPKIGRASCRERVYATV